MRRVHVSKFTKTRRRCEFSCELLSLFIFFLDSKFFESIYCCLRALITLGSYFLFSDYLTASQELEDYLSDIRCYAARMEIVEPLESTIFELCISNHSQL